jgi:tetratricopeptide (TPR) repeat protein
MASGGSWNGDEREAQGERALRLFREMGSQAGMGRVLRTLGSYALRRGDHEQAYRYYLEAFQVAQQIGDVRVMVTCMDLLTLLNPGEALEACDRVVLHLQQGGNSVHLAMMLSAQGDILLGRGQYAQASAVLAESLALWQHLGHQYYDMNGEFGATVLLGIAARALGDLDRAIDQSTRALRLAQEVGSKYGAIIARSNLASAFLAQGKQVQAAGFLRDLLQELHDAFKAVKLPEWTLVFILLAELARRQGNWQQAARLLGISKADARKVDGFPRTLLVGITAWWHLRTRLSGYDSTCSAVREQMGAIAFDALWAEGRAMTLEQAVELARGVVG